MSKSKKGPKPYVIDATFAEFTNTQPLGFICCNKFSPLSGYVYAHWHTDLKFICQECKRSIAFIPAELFDDAKSHNKLSK